MTHDYAIRLLIHGRTVYEGRINGMKTPKEALSWGFYWMPGDWEAGDRDNAVHAEISVIKDDEPTTWKSYWSQYTRCASQISRFTDHDLKCLMAGQDLVWQIYDRNDDIIDFRIFNRKECAEDYTHNVLKRIDCTVRHRWVDGWYDEQYSWKRTEVKGYENITVQRT